MKVYDLGKKMYKITFVDRVLDPVHGFIDLTQVEKEIIELPIFKRMQSIKQLSLTNWVFPGAEHTRYMHSLGVMHIADLMAKSLTDEDNNCYFDDEERQVLRLAGLLHDIGHYPLSHVTESVYLDNLYTKETKISDYNKRTKRTIDLLAEPYKPDVGYMKSRKTKPMHHESLGVDVIENNAAIKSIINNHCSFIDIEDIKDIIVGNVERNPKISAMVQLIHSELDADGIDYIMRDASFSGTSYGSFELGLLLRNLVVRKYGDTDIVGIRPKGISVADQYLISKYFSYTQVIFNRHVAIYNKMAEMLSTALIQLDQSPYPNERTLKTHIETHTKNNNYLKFTDRAFWGQIDSLQKENLENYIEDGFITIRELLAYYQECPAGQNKEIVFTTNDNRQAYELLRESPIYLELEEEREDKLVMFHSRSFTSEIPEQKFRDILTVLQRGGNKALSDKRFKTENAKRLQEGIAIIEKNEDIKLLVDDPRSIMSHIYDTNTYILREYDIVANINSQCHRVV